MKVDKIIFKALFYLTIFSVMIFLVGINETVRETLLFPIVEDNLINPGNTPPEIYSDYLDFKTTYIFTNNPFITFLNFVGLILLFLLFVNAWKVGRNSAPMHITEVFSNFNIMMILLIYFANIIMQYIFDVLVTQLIQELFLDIYNAIYMYQLFVEFFIIFLIMAMLVSFLANYIKYFDIINN